MTIKQLPNNEALEQAMLGAMLYSPENLEDILSVLQLEYFYHIPYYNVAEAMYEMIMIDDIELDLITLKTKLEKKGATLENVGGMVGLAELSELGMEATNWQKIVNELQELYKKREIIKEARNMEKKAYSSNNIDDDILKSFDSINNVLMEGNSRSTTVEDNIQLLEDYIQLNKENGGELIGYSWGTHLEWLDKHTKGIRKGKTYRIGAPSGVGKTNLIYQTIAALLEQNVKVLFVL